MNQIWHDRAGRAWQTTDGEYYYRVRTKEDIGKDMDDKDFWICVRCREAKEYVLLVDGKRTCKDCMLTSRAITRDQIDAIEEERDFYKD